MKKLTAFCWLALSIPLVSSAAEPTLKFTPTWSLEEGLDTPESVVYDKENDRLYVSNIQGNPTDKDGKGYISIVSLSGKLINKAWVRDLNAPKGMSIHKNMLYVADIDSLVAINIDEGKVTQRYSAPDSKFLNDVTTDKQGNVYVSDMFTDTIWCLCRGKFDVWLKNAELESPNGLFAEEKQLVVGSWGVRTTGFQTSQVGHLNAVSFVNNRKISKISEKPVGNLDGVASDGQQGYLATDWMVGKVFHIDATGHAKEVLKLAPGSADATYLPEKKLLLIPMMQNNKLVAYKND